MKWVCAADFLLFDFPIWISAGWMDALLLLLQLRNSLSEFGPVVIRLSPSASSSSLPSHSICRAAVTWEPAHTQKHELLHELLPTITKTREHLSGQLLHEAQLTITVRGHFQEKKNYIYICRLVAALQMGWAGMGCGRGRAHDEALVPVWSVLRG